ncbi:hypothetical protein L1D14_10470 [Vibrio tubiashii]|uniref:hypothetical protein n=1 Tax=Vibrio tubiashii TaxID=29498 RepID=UPI001EFD59F8|nr:hypothetical protein [Vibrio tubiashii]MCG9576661.1 hypothetical protein [Vibrio tubiashii]
MDKVFISSDASQKAHSVVSVLVNDTTVFKMTFRGLKKLGHLDLHQTAEIHALEKLIDAQKLSRTANIYGESCEDLEEYVETSANTLLKQCVFEPKYVPASVFDDKPTELFADGIVESASNVEGQKLSAIPQAEKVPIALTTVGPLILSNKALDDACKIVPSIETMSDLAKYLGEHVAEWTSRRDVVKQTRYFECGRFVFLVDFDTTEARLPIVVYGFESTSHYSSIKTKYKGKDVFFTEKQWTALYNIAESVDTKLFGDYASTSLSKMLSNGQAVWGEVNEKLSVLSFGFTDFRLFVDRDGFIANDAELLELGAMSEPNWRAVRQSHKGEIRITKTAAKKLARVAGLENRLCSEEFNAVLDEAFSSDSITTPRSFGKAEFSWGRFGLNTIRTESELLANELIPSSKDYFFISNRFGIFKLSKEGVVADNFKRSFKVCASTQLTQELVDQLTSGEVTLHTNKKTGLVNQNEYGQSMPLIFRDAGVLVKVKRGCLDGTYNDALEVVYSEEINTTAVSKNQKPVARKPYRTSVRGEELNISQYALRKLKLVLGISDIDEIVQRLNACEDNDYMRSFLGDGYRELKILDSKYALLLDDTGEVEDVTEHRSNFFYILRPGDRSFVIRRNSKIEYPLQQNAKKYRMAKSYQQLREVLSKAKCEVSVQELDDVEQIEFYYPDSKLRLIAKRNLKSSGQLGGYALPTIVSFSFN